MPGTFFANTTELSAQVGDGTLSMQVEVNQVYAGYQEFREDLRHPRGGQAHALRDSLYEKLDCWMQTLADRAITPDGSDLDGAAIDVVEGISSEYLDRAPKEFVNLARSAHPTVESDGETVYDRAPYVERLSEAQLRAQRWHGHSLDYGAGGMPRL